MNEHDYAWPDDDGYDAIKDGVDDSSYAQWVRARRDEARFGKPDR